MFHVMPGMFGGIGGNRNGPFPGPSFFLPLSDAGAGAVNTVPIMAAGGLTATFTRATVAWTKLSSGLWASVASGTARSCYLGQNTAVGDYGGYLAEAAGVQLVTPTATIRDMTQAQWVSGGGGITAAKTATGIDGLANVASTLTAAGVNGTILQTLTAAASSRTYSAFVRRKTGTGTVTLKSGGSTLDITALINSTTYTRVSLTDSTLNTTFGFQINTTADAIEVDFNQFEAGGFATSPMDAAGAARNADVLSYVFAGNADATQGSGYAELSTVWTTSPANSVMAIGFMNGNGAPLMVALSSASTTTNIHDGTNTVSKTGLTSLTTGVRKRASSWSGSAMQVTGDGAVVATGTFDGNLGSTAIAIGCDTAGARSWSGTIKNVRIWTQQLTNAQLQALTAG